MSDDVVHVRFTEVQTAWHVALPVVSPWQRVTDAVPEEGTWCWVWDGGPPLLIAKRDNHVASGWSNDDTWEDFSRRITHWLAIPVPAPPGEALHAANVGERVRHP